MSGLSLFVAVLVLFLTAPICGETPSPGFQMQSQSVAPQVAAEARRDSMRPDLEGGLIKLDLVVTEKAGKPVTGLQSTNFTVLDNGQSMRLLSFDAHTGTAARQESPFQVILVLDTLRLPALLRSHEREEVEKFLKLNNGNLSQPVSVYKLVDSGLWLVAQPSEDGNGLADAIAHDTQLRLIRKAFGPRHFGVAPEEPPGLLSLQALADIATAERQKPGRKLLLWIGPYDQENGAPFHRDRVFNMIVWFSTLMRDSRITLFNLSEGENDRDPRTSRYKAFLNGVRSVHEAEFEYLDRKVLAVESGGRALNAKDDLAGQISSCVEEEGNFYTVSFNPAPADHPNDYHTLTIQVAAPRSTARSNTGYYDQPYYQDHSSTSAKSITVEQLGEMLSGMRGKSDRDSAERLSRLKLTERLNGTKLTSWTAELHGGKAKQALIALADQSAFLPPPTSEIPAEPPPDPVAQRKMIALTDDYLNEVIPKLPNFYATRTTSRYEETPPDKEDRSANEYQPLHVVDISKAMVLYRQGQEVIRTAASKQTKRAGEEQHLTAYGTFGPILSAAIGALVSSSDFSWSRWEQGSDGRQAVFRYVIPQPSSHFQVGFCCLPDGDGRMGFTKTTGYHGEITINPDNGAMLRFTMEADLEPGLPLVQSAVVVDYGEVEIGGKSYICPVKSVAIWRSRTVSILALTDWGESFRSYGPFATMLSDISFDHYHLFRADSRILTGSDSPPPEQR